MSWEGQYIQGTAVHLSAGFKDLGGPVTGAAATIDIWYPGDGAVPTVDGAAMTEQGGVGLGRGAYYYNTAGLAGAGIYKARAMIVASNLYAYGSFEIIVDRVGAILTTVTNIDTNQGEPTDIVTDGTVHGKLGSTAEFSGHKSVKGEIIDIAEMIHTQPW